MSLTVCEHVANTHDRISCLRTLLCALMESLFDSWDVLIWNIIADCGVLEDAGEVGIRVVDLLIDGLHVADDSRVLTSTATLFLVQIVEGSLSAD